MTRAHTTLLYPTLACLLYVCAGGANAKAQTQLDLETGPILTGQNNVRIPGDGGTLFSLKDDLVAETTGYVRLRLGHTFNEAHTLSLLVAPLSIESKGSIKEDVFFNGATFPADTPLKGTYQFNSYRLTYRYLFFHTQALKFGIGLTAKVRDASIVLESPDDRVERKSLGVVPLPNFYLCWRFLEDWGLLFEGDAYAGPGGRAIDVQLAGTVEIFENLNLRLGYRILDGGAGNYRVYGFARFHYGAVGITTSLY